MMYMSNNEKRGKSLLKPGCQSQHNMIKKELKKSQEETVLFLCKR